jgi:hypothetical protein
MKDIVNAFQAKGAEITEMSKDLTPGGYDIDKEIERLKNKFPLSFASGEEPEAEPEGEEGDEGDNTPGTWSVTHTPSNRTARIPANSRADLIRKLTTKYPNYPVTDYAITKEA